MMMHRANILITRRKRVRAGWRVSGERRGGGDGPLMDYIYMDCSLHEALCTVLRT